MERILCLSYFYESCLSVCDIFCYTDILRIFLYLKAASNNRFYYGMDNIIGRVPDVGQRCWLLP